MKSLIAALTSALILLAPSSQAGEERRLVGYANGKPLYVKGGVIVRPALPVRKVSYAATAAPRRCRVNVGCSQIMHGPTYFGGGNYYGGGANYGGEAYYGGGAYYGGDYNGYGWGGGHYPNGGHRPPVQRRCQIVNPCGWNGGYTCGPNGGHVQPYPTASRAGYAWIPRYGSTTVMPKNHH